jgi:hypothetical protein
MRTRSARALFLVAAVLLAPRTARSQAVYGLRAFGGYNTYAFGDWQDINRALLVPPGEEARPTDGYSLGVGVEYSSRPALSFTFSYERLTPGRMPEVNGQKMKLPCNALLLEAEYRRRFRPRIRIGAGGGAGYYQLGEEVESPGTDRNMDGTSFGGQAFALGEWTMTPAASIGLDIGYRWAKIGVDKVNGRPPGFSVESDYSGLNTRIVLRYLPRRAP